MRSLLVSKKSIFLTTLILFCLITMLLTSFIKMIYISFSVYVLVVYFLVLPKKLLNPKNIVFGYYLFWYGIAPMKANRYLYLLERGEHLKISYAMFAITYAIIMITLEVIEAKRYYELSYHKEKRKISYIEKVFLFVCYFFSMSFYIIRTGGLSLWLYGSASEAFFSRGGSGVFFLVFEYSMFLLLFFAGKEKGFFRKCPYIFLCIITMFFCGSKSLALVFVLMFFSGKLMRQKLLSLRSIALLALGVVIFIIGMYIRNSHIMTNISSIISTCFNYFDTLDEFQLVLRDYPPSFAKTIALPINWIITKLGFSLSIPYHDTSIWLTTIYYPDSWANGGTHQWPLESYLYLNFYYFFGIPFVIVYFAIIGILYKKAQNEEGIFRFIYLSEIMRIISHLRGGLFNYWYIYLLPFYFLLWIWEKYGKTSIKKNKCEVESV